FRLPEFKPNNPLGQEFVVPTSGFFCNLCLVFYRNKKTAREVHCSSRRHYDNLQKYYREIEQNSRQSSQSSISE
ncbi:Matrin-3, partial [Takifugu flavidus]